MKATTITESDMAPLRIASLPTRPTAPAAFGGIGYTAREMKEAFDRLPELVAARYNDLCSDVSEGNIPTGIDDVATLAEFFAALATGEVLSYIRKDGVELGTYLTNLAERISALENK